MARVAWESWKVTPVLFAAHKALYRLLGGRLVGKNVLILTTRGRRSGRARSTPLFFARDGDDYVVVASNGGEARQPNWWHNLRADPNVSIQVGRHTMACRAERARSDDVPRLWAKLLLIHGGYETYRRRTARELTLFRLRPLTRHHASARAERTPDTPATSEEAP
jgi:deazaflavin-dependent oxidoreductase (nitroreductase family)